VESKSFNRSGRWERAFNRKGRKERPRRTQRKEKP